MTCYLLGLSAYYHDSAAALLKDGEIVAAAQEERFTRKKHDASFPKHAILYCLKEAGVTLSQVDAVAFYDKPLLTFERLLETYLTFAPRGISSFLKSMPVWLKEKLLLKRTLGKELADIGLEGRPNVLFTHHHQSHAASAFFPGPFRESAVLCIDGVGEWATTTGWRGEGHQLEMLWQINFPHSLGLLYSTFTNYLGFQVNSDEYKVMGLAPYGEPRYVDLITRHLIDVKQDGTFRLNMKYFGFATGMSMINRSFSALFGLPPRQPHQSIRQEHMDIARSIQHVIEEAVLKLARTLHKETGLPNLCLAGGVALNCVANGRVLREGPFENIWIQPAAGDAGGALGAALATWYQYLGHERTVLHGQDAMKGALLGPSFEDEEIKNFLDQEALTYKSYEEPELYEILASLLASGAVVGWFQDRMEFGPRALGARSILGDPRKEKMQALMNQKIKFRESFRPFAPSVLREDLTSCFDLDRESPYMLLVAPVQNSIRQPLTERERTYVGLDQLGIPRSSLPAVTHVDYSARVQTVTGERNHRYYRLLKAFKAQTGCPVLINTSFNVRGEPIVCTPRDAYNCFMRTNIDYLVLGKHVIAKKESDVTAPGCGNAVS